MVTGGNRTSLGCCFCLAAASPLLLLLLLLLTPQLLTLMPASTPRLLLLLLLLSVSLGWRLLLWVCVVGRSGSPALWLLLCVYLLGLMCSSLLCLFCGTCVISALCGLGLLKGLHLHKHVYVCACVCVCVCVCLCLYVFVCMCVSLRLYLTLQAAHQGVRISFQLLVFADLHQSCADLRPPKVGKYYGILRLLQIQTVGQ